MSGSNAFEGQRTEELQALKSIFDNDFQIEGDAVIIRVHPLNSDPNKDDNDSQIDLHVVCPDNYPDSLPIIAFENCKGLSNKQIKILSGELENLKVKLKGKQMIYDLASHVLNYLLDNNKPRRKSFYDEMICRKKQEEAKFKSDEDRRLRKIYDVQKKVRRKMEESNSSEDDDCDSKYYSPSIDQKAQFEQCGCTEMNNKTLCCPSSCFTSKYIHFESKILRGSCTDHRECSTVYCALDTTTGEQLTVHEWVLKPSQRTNEIEKILKSIQNEINYLKILNHENLNSYIDIKWCTDRDDIIVYIAEKYISDITLKIFRLQHKVIHLNEAQYIVESILTTLLYLHDHKVVHKNLNEENIFITKSGKIKVASCSVTKRMDDLHRMCRDGGTSTAKADQKTDVKQLGLILNSILEHTAGSDDQDPVSHHKILEFKDFIEKCLIKNEERRWGARELLDHKFLKKSSSYEPSRKRTTSYSTVTFEANDEVQDQYDFPVEEQSSRLLKDFYILEDIGKGSFGKVLKVRNKLDRQIYAIKEIKLDKNIKQLDKKIIGEVKLLSKLKHENVVRYYTSWIETYSETESRVTENMDKSKEDDDDDDDDDDEEEEDDDSSDDGFWQKNDEKDGSFFVVFQADDAEKVSDSVSVKQEELKKSEIFPTRIMYIQMEFCEKSTLKYAIKNNLYEQEARCWRLLREIVEGLTYIHAQGLIHRDLKPDNIFLDSYDHVKIGDFGLAKIREMSKSTLIVTDVSLGGGDYDNSYYTQGGSNTAGVGTSYYVAPEMGTTFEKSHYNEKVDIYSLGIIFFEMCHPPFNTGMERHDVLTKLRKPDVVVPAALEEKMSRQMDLVRKLLNHAPVFRPSSKEILEDHVPPAEVEFEELKEIVRKTLMNPESKAFKYLISSWLNQKINIDEDITYHLKNFHSDKFHVSLEMAKEPIENIFKNHGGVFLSTPLLLPQNEVYAKIDGRVKLITQSGAIVNLPYDLRVPFARYVTLKDVRRLRRYTIDRVHRQQKVDGVLPKELYECAFDIVSPKLGHLADEWEMLYIMDEVVNSIPSLKNRHCIILLNHSLILRALLIYCNAEKFYSEIFRFLIDAKINKHAKRQLEANLLSLELGIQAVKTLVNFFDKEETVYALKEELLALFSNREEVYEAAEKGFSKLSKIIEGTENSGINVPIKVRLGVVCNTEYCSDIMFDLVCKTKHKRGKQSSDVIMSGCRYDGLLRNFRKLFSVMNVDVKEANQSAIGVSICLDKIASILKEDNILSEQVVVCSTDQWMLNEHKSLFIKELRESGIKCYFEDDIDSMEELLEYCGENKITHVVNMKEENGLVLIMSWDSSKCRYREKRITKREVAEYIVKNTKSSDEQGIGTYQRSESKTPYVEIATANQSFNIHILSEEKSLTRRKHENQIRSKITPILRFFSPKTRIEVVGVDLDESEISRLTMSFKPDDGCYMAKILSAADRSSKKAYLSKICKKLESFFTPEKSNTVVILYGLGHDQYQMILGYESKLEF